jgi:cell division protein FtsN
MAVQDLTPDEADARLAVWAGFARPNGGPAQVATLLGVKPATDSGLPTRLALISPARPVAVAAAEVPAVRSVVAPEPVAVAEKVPAFETPAPAEPVTVQPVVVAAAPASALIRAEPQPARQAVKWSPQRTVAAKPALKPIAAPVPQLRNASVQRTKPGKFVVQLGAFQTAASAQQAWDRISGRVNLANYQAVNGAAKLGNASLVRLSVSSFEQRADADKMCARIKQAGNVCFVRIQAGDSPARWVQKNTFKVASR